VKEIVWIAKHKDEITEWFQEESGIFEQGLQEIEGVRNDGLVWYESFITNYVAHHAQMFRGDKPEQVWFELNLGDTRTDEQLKSRARTDLLLQFPDEVWIVEVKYEANNPDMDTALVQNNKEQLEAYGKQLEQLMKNGWFPKRRIRLAMFWAYWHKRTRKKMLDEQFSKWPIDR
jgi:hypothetical protein